MFTALQSMRVKGSAGDPLPVVFESLDKTGTRLLRGQLVLVCAAPGTGKSAFVLTYAAKARTSTLYFSADSDAFTQLTRLISILGGWTLEESARAVRNEELGEAEGFIKNLPIRFSYNASPSLDQIEDSMKAYIQLTGDYPGLVVVDNITNVRTGVDDDEPFSGLEALMDYLHDMARRTDACVIGLHHVTGPYNDGNKPIPLGGIKNQIGRVPEVVLTLHKGGSTVGPETINVSTVKNRSGRMDPSGESCIALEFDGDTMTIQDL